MAACSSASCGPVKWRYRPTDHRAESGLGEPWTILGLWGYVTWLDSTPPKRLGERLVVVSLECGRRPHAPHSLNLSPLPHPQLRPAGP